MYLLLSLFALLGSIILCVLPPSLPELSAASDKEALLPQSSESVGILEGMKNCYYLLTTPKFLLLFFTLFSNGMRGVFVRRLGYIALFVPTQMNRQVHDNVIVGIFMSLYACGIPRIRSSVGSEIVFSKMGAYISDRYGAYYVIIMGSISQIIGQCLMMVNDSSQRVWVYCIAYLFHGGADACFQTQALALTLYYFPGLSATANSCFRLIQFVSGAVCSITTPLYLKDGVVEWGGFLMENGVIAALLALSFVCLTVFVVRYKKEIEVDDVCVDRSCDSVEIVDSKKSEVCCLLETVDWIDVALLNTRLCMLLHLNTYLNSMKHYCFQMSKIVAVDIGGTKMVLYTKYGGVERRKREETGNTITPQQIVAVIREFIAGLDFVPDALGVCVPGLVENGTLIVASDRPNMVGLTEEMLSTPEYKAYMINDLRAAMFSQLPKYPKNSSICVIVVGTGIGMSVVLNGHFLTGAKGWVGEWGLCPVRLEDGRIVSADAVLTGKGILAQAGLSAQEVIQKLEEGDERITKIVNDAGLYCGLCLAYCVNLFNPEYIILTGSTTHYKNYRAIALRTLEKYALKSSLDVCKVVNPEEEGDIVILGTLEYARMIYEGEEMP